MRVKTCQGAFREIRLDLIRNQFLVFLYSNAFALGSGLNHGRIIPEAGDIKAPEVVCGLFFRGVNIAGYHLAEGVYEIVVIVEFHQPDIRDAQGACLTVNGHGIRDATAGFPDVHADIGHLRVRGLGHVHAHVVSGQGVFAVNPELF